jgi:alkylated DNA repair protein alkB family protein 1
MKVYNEDDFTPVPVDIVNITKFIANVLGFAEFTPEAGIINYYHLNSTLSAHQDYSEKNMQAPLISISLGSPAIFLIGGHTKQTKPSPILLRSGDVTIMSGQSRLAYHAVPKILFDPNLDNYFSFDESEKDQQPTSYFIDDKQWKNLHDYIKINRINLNIRQVN